MKNKGSTTAISISVISALIAMSSGLIAFIYTTNMSEAKGSIKEIQEVNITQGKEISEVQTDIKYIKESQDKINAKLDRILNKF